MRFLDVKTDFAFKKVFGSEDSTEILIDFLMFDSPSVTSRFKLLEKQGLIEYSDDIELIFIELPKFNLDEPQLTTAKDCWLYFVKNAGSLNIIPDSLAKQPHIQQAFGIANEAGMSQEQLDAQDKRHDFIRLQRGSIEKALQDGLVQGREEGLEQGIEQGEQRRTLQIAATLLDILDDVTIASKTDLTEAQVAELRYE